MKVTPINLPDGTQVYEEYHTPQKKGFLNQIKEYFIGEGSTTPARVVNPNLFSFLGERPETEFAQLIYYFDRTPQLQTALYGYIYRIFGTELQVNTDNKTIKDFLEDWNNRTKAFQKYRECGTTALICGSALLEKLDENSIQDIKPVKMSTILGKRRDQYNLKVEYYIQRLNDGKVANLGKDLPDARERFVEFHLNYYDQNDWGRSLFYSLAVERQLAGYDFPVKPLIEVMWQVEEAMGNIFTNHAEPMKYITYQGANKEYIDNQALQFKKRRVGSTFFGDRKPEIDIVETKVSEKYESFIDHLNKAFQLGTQFPYDIMTGDFTSRASSETTDNAIEKAVKAYQTYFIQVILDEIYTPLLKANGYSDLQIKKANISLSFGTPNVLELLTGDIISLESSGNITKDEMREWLKDNTGLDLFDDDVIQQQVDTSNAIQQQILDNPEPPQKGTSSRGIPPVQKETKSVKCMLCKEGQHALCTKRRCKCDHGEIS